MTVLSMSMITALSPAKAATAEAGDLIKMEGLSSVYYLGQDGERYVFPNEDTYFSWYSDFSSVVTIPQAELESYPLGSNVNIRPGTQLVKITTDPTVYAVEKGGTLRAIPYETTAEALYGENWAKRVVDVPDAFFVNYTIDEGNEVSSDAYPQGTVVKHADSSESYYIKADGEAQPIKDETSFKANMFQWNFVVNASEDYELPTQGAEIVSANENLIDVSEGTSEASTGTVGSGLSVAVSNNTPASATIPKGATKVAFTTVNLTASNDGPVTIDDLTLTRIGVGDENELGKVYLYEGMTKVEDGENISNDDVAEFNNVDYVVPAGETKTLTVRANNVTGISGNHGFSIDEASDIVTNGASVSGSFPVTGNLMSLSAVQAGSLTFNFDSVNDSVKVGEEQKEMSEFLLRAGDQEDVALRQATLTNEGSADMTNLENLKLYVDGEVVTELDSANTDAVTLAFDEPYIIEQGEEEDFTLKADVVGEATEDVSFELDELGDIVGIGQTYGYLVGVYVGSFGGTDVATENNDSASTVSIETGELTVIEADSNPNAKDIARGEEDATALIAELQSKDETLTIQELDVDITLSNETSATSSDDYLENVTLYLDGERVAGPEDVTFNGNSTSTTVTFDDSIEVDGTHELEVQADFTDVARYGDYVMEIISDNMEVENSSGDSINDINGTATGNPVTVDSPTPTLMKDSTYGDQDVVSGEEILVGRYILEAADAEALEIDNYQVDIGFATTSDATTSLVLGDVEDLRVNNEDYITSPEDSNDFLVDEELAAGEEKVVNVYLTISDDVIDDNIDSQATTTLEVKGQGKVSGEDIENISEAEATADGQTVTLKKGELTVATNSATPEATIMLAESEGNDVGKWEFAAENVGYTISEVEITAYKDSATTTNESAVTGMTFGNATDNTPQNGEFVFDTNIEVAKDNDVKVMATADFNDIGNMSNNNVQFAITGHTEKANNKTVKTDVVDDSFATDELMEVYDSKITVSTAAGDTTSLKNGENYITDVTVSNDGGVNDSDAILESLEIDVVNSVDADGTTTDLSIDSADLVDSNDNIVVSDATSSDDFIFSSIPAADGTIASGQSETYQVRINVTGAELDDSMTVQVVESNFIWSDNTSDIDGSLVDELPSDTYELIR